MAAQSGAMDEDAQFENDGWNGVNAVREDGSHPLDDEGNEESNEYFEDERALRGEF